MRLTTLLHLLPGGVRKTVAVTPFSGVPRGGLGCSTPPEIPKALQNCAKLADLRKLLKIAEFRTPAPQDVRKKGSKILKLPRFAIVLY